MGWNMSSTVLSIFKIPTMFNYVNVFMSNLKYYDISCLIITNNKHKIIYNNSFS